MTRVVLVAGTHAWRPDKPDWFMAGQPFYSFLQANGVQPVDADNRPFCWCTDLGGVGFGDDDLAVWLAGGQNLFAYIVPPLCPDKRIPPRETNLIAHSHGMQIALVACAAGLKVNTLITVGGPVRDDMKAVAAAARPNIARWLHLYSDAHDYMQLLGELFDGGWKRWLKFDRFQRQHPLADRNEFMPEGHSAVLEDPGLFQLWQTQHWLAELTTTWPAKS